MYCIGAGTLSYEFFPNEKKGNNISVKYGTGTGTYLLTDLEILEASHSEDRAWHCARHFYCNVFILNSVRRNRYRA